MNPKKDGQTSSFHDQTTQQIQGILETWKCSLHLELTNMAKSEHENTLQHTKGFFSTTHIWGAPCIGKAWRFGNFNQNRPCVVILKCFNWEMKMTYLRERKKNNMYTTIHNNISNNRYILTIKIVFVRTSYSQVRFC